MNVAAQEEVRENLMNAQDNGCLEKVLSMSDLEIADDMIEQTGTQTNRYVLANAIFCVREEFQ